VPFKKDFLLKYQHLVKTDKPIEVIQEGGYCFILTEDLTCPFLQNGKCVVYDDRPKVCRQYGTTKNMPCIYKNAKGMDRSEAEQKRIRNEWEEKKTKMLLAKALLHT
jgi:Fe-S-cluster containining protein